MIEITGCSVKDKGVAILDRYMGSDLIDQSTIDQCLDRILIAIGIQVADDHHIRIQWDKRAIDEIKQRFSLENSPGVPAALAIALISVLSTGRAGTLRLEVVGYHHETLAGGILHEYLGKG